MKKNILILLVIIFAIYFLPGCSAYSVKESLSESSQSTDNNQTPTYSFKGYVYKSTDRANSGHLIVLTQSTPPSGYEAASGAMIKYKGNTYYSNENGFFSIDDINLDDYLNSIISVYLDGYTPASYSMPVYTNNNSDPVQLQALPSYDNIPTNSFDIFSIYAFDSNGYFVFLNKNNLQYSIDNPSLVKNIEIMNYGEVYVETADTTGTATITISLKDNPSISCSIVINVYNSSDSFQPPQGNLDSGYVYGTIYDEFGNNTLDGYTVKLLNLDTYTEYYSYTTYDGYFSISNLPYGKYEIYILDSNYNELDYTYWQVNADVDVFDGQFTINSSQDEISMDFYINN